MAILLEGNHPLPPPHQSAYRKDCICCILMAKHFANLDSAGRTRQSPTKSTPSSMDGTGGVGVVLRTSSPHLLVVWLSAITQRSVSGDPEKDRAPRGSPPFPARPCRWTGRYRGSHISAVRPTQPPHDCSFSPSASSRPLRTVSLSLNTPVPRPLQAMMPLPPQGTAAFQGALQTPPISRHLVVCFPSLAPSLNACPRLPCLPSHPSPQWSPSLFPPFTPQRSEALNLGHPSESLGLSRYQPRVQTTLGQSVRPWEGRTQTSAFCKAPSRDSHARAGLQTTARGTSPNCNLSPFLQRPQLPLLTFSFTTVTPI